MAHENGVERKREREQKADSQVKKRKNGLECLDSEVGYFFLYKAVRKRCHNVLALEALLHILQAFMPTQLT